jgi:hypothetical protein
MEKYHCSIRPHSGPMPQWLNRSAELARPKPEAFCMRMPARASWSVWSPLRGTARARTLARGLAAYQRWKLDENLGGGGMNCRLRPTWCYTKSLKGRSGSASSPARWSVWRRESASSVKICAASREKPSVGFLSCTRTRRSK